LSDYTNWRPERRVCGRWRGVGYDISDVYGRASNAPLKTAEHAEGASETVEECIRNSITTEIFGVRFLTLVLGDVP
jgi:hypothetical protein